MRVGRYIIGANYWPHIDWQSLVSVKYATCTSSIMHSLCAPQILHNLFFFTSPGYYSHPKRNWKQCLCKIWRGGGRANKAHYGKCASGVWAIFYDWPSGWPLAQWTLDLCWYSSVLLLELESVLEFLKIKKRMFFQKKRARKLKELHINTFCLCLSVVKDWVRKKCFTHKPFRRYWKRIQYGCCWRSLSLSSSSIAVFQTVYWRKCGE